MYGKSPYQAENKVLERLRRKRAKLAAKWKSREAAISAIEARRQVRAREQAMTRAIASNCVYRDGTPRDTPAHREIARRYAWHAQNREKSLPSRIEPYRTGSANLMTRIRLRELERLFSARWGKVLPRNRTGRDAFIIAAHHIAHMGSGAERHIKAWARVWAPWMPAKRVAHLTRSVLFNPAKYKADTLGWRLKLTREEREALAITTIGAVGQSEQERKTLRRRRRRMAERLRRRRKGAKTREEYEASSLTRTKPWEALGISRRTWYRRGRPVDGFGRDWTSSGRS